MVEHYSHGDGRVAVMVEVNCETDFVGRRKHSAPSRMKSPCRSLRLPNLYQRSGYSADVLERESKIAEARAREEGKPDTILPRIIEGSLNKYQDEAVLLRQPYIRDESGTIQEMLNERVGALGKTSSSGGLPAGNSVKRRK